MSEQLHMSGRTLILDRQLVAGSCPRCGREDLRSYPVNSEGGWFQVVKCQNCLLSITRERWLRLGPIQLLSDLL
jgi:transcription elongation factor Elf1